MGTQPIQEIQDLQSVADENILTEDYIPSKNGFIRLVFGTQGTAGELALVVNGGNGIAYQDAEPVTITGVESGATADSTATVVDGVLTTVGSFSNVSGNAIQGEKLIILGGTSGADGAEAKALVGGPITGINLISGVTQSPIGSFNLNSFHTISIPVVAGHRYNIHGISGDFGLFSLCFVD